MEQGTRTELKGFMSQIGKRNGICWAPDVSEAPRPVEISREATKICCFRGVLHCRVVSPLKVSRRFGGTCPHRPLW
jgi:hypothetical protein